MTDTDIHSCGYYCDRPACIKAQRDELRDQTFEDWAKTFSGGKPNYTQPDIPNNLPITNLKQNELMYPLQREWVGLTDEERNEILGSRNTAWEKLLAKAIEAKLKEKNT